MSNEEYQLLAIDETYEIPRALILVTQHGKPTANLPNNKVTGGK